MPYIRSSRCVIYTDEHVVYSRADFCCPDIFRLWNEGVYFISETTKKVFANLKSVYYLHVGTIDVNFCPHCGAEIEIAGLKKDGRTEPKGIGSVS